MDKDLDKKIGRVLRSLRQKRGISQTELGDKIGVTFQQVQKYETGKNRLSGSRMQIAAEVLNVSPAVFFSAEEYALAKDNKMINELVGSFEKLTDKQKHAVLEMVKGMVNASSE